MTCSVDGCEKKPRAKGMCESHYKRARRAVRGRVCSLPGCDRKHQARGLCAAHYSAWTRGLLDHDDEPPSCSDEDCKRPIRAKGLCSDHLRELEAQRFVACGVCGAQLGPLPAEGKPWPLIERHTCQMRRTG